MTLLAPLAAATIATSAIFGVVASCDPPPPPSCTTTISAPASISQAAASLPSGGTLCLHGGTYRQLVSFSHGKVTSVAGESAVVDGTGLSVGSTSHLVDVSGSGDIEDVTVAHSSGRGVRLLDGAQAHRVTVYDTRYEGIIIAGSDNVVDASTVYDACLVNAAHTAAGGWPAALSTWQATSPQITNDTVRTSWGEGIDVDGSDGALVQGNHVSDTWSALVYLDGSSHVTVNANTLETTSSTYDRGGQPAYGVLIGSEGGGPVDHVAVTNNTMHRTRGIYAWDVTPTNFTNSGNTSS